MAASRNWIFIRGLTRGQGHWADFLPLFRARYPQDSVECLDLPGNGERFRETSYIDCGRAARDLRARSETIAAGKRARLLGHSLGGMVAVEWMRQFPADLDGVTLMNTSCRESAPFFKRLNPANARAIARLLAAGDDGFQRERLLLSIIANNRDRAEALLPQLAAYSMAHPVSLSNSVRQILAGARVRFPDQPPVAVEVIGSRGDRLVDVENSLWIANRWGVHPRLHATAGHDLPIDDPDWLLDQFQE